MLRKLGEFWRGVTHLVYPGVCEACQALLADPDFRFCQSCRDSIAFRPHGLCRRCGSTVGAFVSADDGCPRCRHAGFVFDSVTPLGNYDGLLRRLILRIKKVAHENLAENLGRLWVDERAAALPQAPARVVVPVPLHWSRQWMRGYNQSEAIARVLAQHLGLPIGSGIIKRIRATPIQPLQSAAARHANVAGSFRCKKQALHDWQSVLLVDDVLTTGSTANEVSRVLKSAGFSRVDVVILARSN